jgi:hypothetical protein
VAFKAKQLVKLPTEDIFERVQLLVMTDNHHQVHPTLSHLLFSNLPQCEVTPTHFQSTAVKENMLSLYHNQTHLNGYDITLGDKKVGFMCSCNLEFVLIA